MRFFLQLFFLSLILLSSTAFLLPLKTNSAKYIMKMSSKTNNDDVFNPLSLNIEEDSSIGNYNNENNNNNMFPLSMLSIASIMIALPVNAASGVTGGGDSFPAALSAYGHYLGLILVSMSLTCERLLIKPNMTEEEEQQFTNADIVYGLAGTVVLVTGFFRVTKYAKGWEFYSHEPIFWLKMVLFTVMGSASFFPTIKMVQRAVARKNGEDVAPISDKLAQRMTTLINGELLAIGSIPLTATFMARGIGHIDNFPWQVGAGAVGLSVVGLGTKYVKEALDWVDEDDDVQIGLE